MPFCTHCGSQSADDARFCPGCGRPVGSSGGAATAVAVEPTRVVRVGAARLRAICDEDPQFGYEFMRRAMLALAKRLSATWSQLSHMYVSHFLPLSAGVEECNP